MNISKEKFNDEVYIRITDSKIEDTYKEPKLALGRVEKYINEPYKDKTLLGYCRTTVFSNRINKNTVSEIYENEDLYGSPLNFHNKVKCRVDMVFASRNIDHIYETLRFILVDGVDIRIKSLFGKSEVTLYYVLNSSSQLRLALEQIGSFTMHEYEMFSSEELEARK